MSSQAKLLTLMLVFLVMVGMLSACGPAAPEAAATEAPAAAPASSSSAAPASSAAETSVSSASQPAETIELTWIQWWETEIGEDLLNRIEAKFMEEHPGVKIKREDIPSTTAMYEKLLTLAKAKQLPDVICMQAWWLPIFEPMGVLENLDSYRGNEEFVIKGTWKGHEWMNFIYGGPEVAFYNKDMFDAKGVKPPDTWDEYMDMLQKLNDPANGKYGGILYGAVHYSPWFYAFYPALFGAGGRMTDDNGVPAFNDAAGVKAMEFLKKQYDSNWVLPGTLSNREDEMRTAWQAGNLGYIIEGPWEVGITKHANVKFKYAAALTPKGPAGLRGSLATGSGVAMNADGKHKELAWEFIKFLTMGEGNKMWTEETQNLPVYKPLLDQDWIKQDPYLSVMVEQYKDKGTISYMPAPTFDAAFQSFATEFQEYLQGNKDAQKALDDAKAGWLKLLEK